MKTKFKSQNEFYDMLNIWYDSTNEYLPTLSWNSVFTHNESIYSYGYHFELSKKSNRYLLINHDRTTKTTSKHRHIVSKWAVNRNLKIVCGNNVDKALDFYIDNIKKQNHIPIYLNNTYHFIIENKKNIDKEIVKKHAWLFQRKNAKIIKMMHSDNKDIKSLGIKILKEKKYIA